MADRILYIGAAGASRNSVNAAGDATYTTLAEFTIPKNTVKAGSIIRLNIGWRCTNSAAAKNIQVLVGGNQVRASSSALTNNASLQDMINIVARSLGLAIPMQGSGAANTFGASTGLPSEFAIDWTQDQKIELQARWSVATASEFIEVGAFVVELLTQD